MKILILITILATLTCSCASPYAPHAQRLADQYQSGEITASEYNSGIAQLEQLELQRQTAVSNAFNNFAVYQQRQQAIQQMNRPQTIYLWRMNR